MPAEPRPQPGLSRFAAFTALATLGLIALGGLVTSHGAGMAVPDWPTTYGYNMFLFPISQWVGGIFYEHTHRLWASGVGFLTILLAVGFHLRADDRRLARLAWFALALVILQGVLGGLRVSLMKDEIGIFHAALAQAFLVLVTWLAVATSRWWHAWRTDPAPIDPGLARFVTVATLAIFAQLVLGATMRHQHAGLAIPDFPLAYGRVWPSTDAAFLQQINALRTDTRDFSPIMAFQVHLHLAHRGLGVVITALVLVAAIRLRRAAAGGSLPWRLGSAWAVAILAQILLGAATVWTNKAADVATAHVVVGAMTLGIGALATAVCRAGLRSAALAPAPGRRISDAVGDAVGTGRQTALNGVRG